MTGNDIISDALFASGVVGTGQTVNADMAARALRSLNMMLAQWNTKRWLIYHLVNTTKAMTGGISYTVGPGGDFNLAVRPTAIEAAFASQLVGTYQQIDTPLEILTAREDYNRISMKQLISLPYYIYYDAGIPLGTVYPWPAPNANLYSVTLTVKEVLSQIPDPTQAINLPAEYQEALTYNLAARMCIMYQEPVPAGVVGLARAALGTIRANNAQIPLLQMPSGLSSHGRYNVYSNISR